MRRKSIGATSQAFHEPMSTGAFLEFLTRRLPGCRAQGLLARFLVGPAPAAEMLERPSKPLKLRFFANVLVGAWRRRGCRLKRLLRRGGTWRETKPGYPPYPPPRHPPRVKGERKRVFTLSAFGNHPTRPPRSADFSILYNIIVLHFSAFSGAYKAGSPNSSRYGTPDDMEPEMKLAL